jgi:hypothetical protein
MLTAISNESARNLEVWLTCDVSQVEQRGRFTVLNMLLSCIRDSPAATGLTLRLAQI